MLVHPTPTADPADRADPMSNPSMTELSRLLLQTIALAEALTTSAERTHDRNLDDMAEFARIMQRTLQAAVAAEYQRMAARN